MNKLIDINLFKENLSSVIENDDEILIFYIGIWSFINFLDISYKDIPKVLLQTIEKVVGKNRTIVLPSFTANEFVITKKFDSLLSKPKESGVISIQALKSGNYVRTIQPLHSYLVKGPKAKEIKKLTLKTSWGEGSILSWLSKNKSRVCTIGIPWKIGCSYFHRFEELYQVPWRYFKKFEGKHYKNKEYLGKIYEMKYSGPLLVNFSYDYSPVIYKMTKNKIIKRSKTKTLNIQSALVSDIDVVCNEFFNEDPWRIIKNKDKILYWVKELKNKEIELQK